MKSQPFEAPRLFVTKADDLPLSGKALLELMRAVLARGVPFRFCAKGWSMAPFIRDGDVITVSPLAKGQPRLGEVLAFVRAQADTPVVHRVVGRRHGVLVIRGDSAPSGSDHEVVSTHDLLGRVTRVERAGHAVWLGLGPERYLIAWLSRRGWLLPLRRRLGPWLKPLLGGQQR